jgi:hypothetical protein
MEYFVPLGDPLARDAGPRALLNALARLTGGYDKQAAPARQDLAIAEGQRRDYDCRRGTPFVHKAYLAELTSARDRLKAALSGATPEPVTARFRRRIDPPIEPEPVVELEYPAPPTITEPILLRIDAVPPALAMPKPTYQDRVSRDKPEKARQVSML